MNIDRADNFIASLGVEAYRVGGSVRDEILGRTPKDADYIVRGIGLNELADLVQAQGRDLTVGIIKDRRGQAFGVRLSSRQRRIEAEIALPRREENAGSGRAQTIVADPNITLAEDAQRRDFTFNAIYKIIAHPEGLRTLQADARGQIVENVIDPTERGLYDLQRGMIQTTHPDSFRDDPLRMLRALRFMARGFMLTAETTQQMRRWTGAADGLTVNGFTSGTVLDEMSKILMGDRVGDALRVARDTGLLAVLFPELASMIGFDQGSRYHDMTTDNHTFATLEMAAKVDAPLRVRWALLFHDAGKPDTAWRGDDGRLHYYANIDKGVVAAHEVVGEGIWRRAADRIGASKELREDVATLIRNHMVPLDGKFKGSKVRRGRVKFGDAMLRDLYMHRACDVSGKGKPDINALHRLEAMEQKRAAAQQAGIPATVGELAINGHTLQSMGIRGPEIGRVLRTLLDEVACQPSETSLDPDWQMKRACSIAAEGYLARAVSDDG